MIKKIIKWFRKLIKPTRKTTAYFYYNGVKLGKISLTKEEKVTYDTIRKNN